MQISLFPDLVFFGFIISEDVNSVVYFMTYLFFILLLGGAGYAVIPFYVQ